MISMAGLEPAIQSHKLGELPWIGGASPPMVSYFFLA